MKALTVAFTGRTGSIGKVIAETHAAREVIALKTRLEANVGMMRAELDPIAKPFAFLHLAALTLVQECEKDPERTFRLNVDGAVQWLQAAAQAGCQRFVFVSTGHVFRPTSQLEWLEPSRTPDATSVYGRSKAEAEKRLIAEATCLGVPLVIARVFSVIGRGMRPGFLYPELERRVRERDLSPLPGYKNVRDFIDVREAAATLYRLASAPDREADGARIVHLGSGVPRTVRELAIEVFRVGGITDDRILAGMFPETRDVPNFLVSRPPPFDH